MESEMALKDYGFIEVGEWTNHDNLSGITFRLNNLEQERVIYAFVANEEVKYCDKSKTTLQDRMKGYKNRPGESTNKRIAEEIKNCLNKKIPVRIFAFNPNNLINLYYRGVEVDLVRGLEFSLIHKLNPDWNIQK